MRPTECRRHHTLRLNVKKKKKIILSVTKNTKLSQTCRDDSIRRLEVLYTIRVVMTICGQNGQGGPETEGRVIRCEIMCSIRFRLFKRNTKNSFVFGSNKVKMFFFKRFFSLLNLNLVLTTKVFRTSSGLIVRGRARISPT